MGRYIIKEAKLKQSSLSLRENIKSKLVSKKHFDQALKKVKPSLSPEEMKKYKEKEEEYIQKAKSGAIKEARTYIG